MASMAVKDLAKELDSRSIAMPNDTRVLDLCRNTLVRSAASVEDVATSIEAVLMNLGTETITEAVMLKAAAELSKSTRKTVGKAVTHVAPTPVRRFNKGNASKLPGFGSASFESAFNVTIGSVKTERVPAGSGSSRRPPVRHVPSPSRSGAGRRDLGAGSTTGSVPKRKAVGQPARSPPMSGNKSRRLANAKGTPSPASHAAALKASPAGVEYASRTNAGKVEAQLNGAMKGPAQTPSPEVVDVQLLPKVLDKNVKAPYRFMLTLLESRAASLEQRVLDMEAAIVEAHPTLPPVTPVGVASQSQVVVVGRICLEDGAKLTRGSILLEGSRRTSNSARVAVNVRGLPVHNLFPGQVVAIKGMCTTGTQIVAQQIIEGTFPAVIRPPPEELRAARTLRMWSAAGPFTLASDLNYKPLNELLAEALAATPPPDVICLMGPFVDVHHPSVATGNVSVGTGATAVPLTFAELFSQRVERALASYLCQPRLQNTHVVLVPSVHDADVLPVVPQPPMPQPQFDVVDKPEDRESVKARVHVLSNPGTCTINGVVVGVSTLDFMRHVAGVGLFRHPHPAPHLFARLAAAMLRQRSYYPLYPPAPGTPLELPKYNHVMMPVLPDVLLVPSGLPHFAKLVNNVVVVNPGRLVKGTAAGTYSKVTVFPMPRARLDAAERSMKQHREKLKQDAGEEGSDAGEGDDDSAGAGAGVGAGAGTAAKAPSRAEARAAAIERLTSPAHGVLPLVSRRTKVEIVRI